MSRSESIMQPRAQVSQPLALLARALLWMYRVTLSPLFGPCCRFVPSCSAYAAEAVHRYGVVRGSWMTLRRLLRCHPFHPGGWDPVR